MRDDLFGTHASAQYTAEHIRGARFVDYERGGHMWLGHHLEIVEAIAAFVQSIGAEEDNRLPPQQAASAE